MTDYKSINTYPEMNKTIKDLLIRNKKSYTLYAAKLIEELESKNKILSKELRKECDEHKKFVSEIADKIAEVKKETARECLKILHSIGGCGAEEEWAKGFDAAIDEAYKEISDKYGVTAFDEDDEE